MTTTTIEADPRIGTLDVSTWQAIPAPKPGDCDPEERLGGYCVVAGDCDEADVWIEVTAEHPEKVAEFIVQAVQNEYASLTPAPSNAPDYDLRDDLQGLMSPQPGAVWIKDVIAHIEPELAKLREERDLAVAHDRQPYPTAWAYTQACRALEYHRQRADKAEAELARIRGGR